MKIKDKTDERNEALGGPRMYLYLYKTKGKYHLSLTETLIDPNVQPKTH